MNNSDAIIDFAVRNLHEYTGITCKWEKDAEGNINLRINTGHELLEFSCVIMQQPRLHQLPHLLERAANTEKMIVVASHFFPGVKEELRKNRVAYMQANGSFYVYRDGVMIWIEQSKPFEIVPKAAGKAFSKTGLKVVFSLLKDDSITNLTYRKIAEQTGVAIGTVKYVWDDLTNAGFLIKSNRREYKLLQKEKLLEKWMDAYAVKLKPSIHTGTFRFLNEDDFDAWREVPLEAGKTFWGGEPAGDIYTNYLRPEILTIYSTETSNELIKNYKLFPDPGGNVQVYQKFWHTGNMESNAVPPLLAYADLMNTGDRRCMETAKKVYNDHLQAEV
ncbi:type IV toxin-antitoxin system AbiEi family antitoxin [Foetidibacter luteolus]|uniref:type IV toxin-antitoxin system AbiEi family antitoxin n=1 Tax=Foetidibacter luteolus TaxID=2608880 RepID=UPI00129A3C0F|nr:type IV toxin-antitoxin system AbiEi family antitoxin [Foetidibacter luteolus]